MKTSRVWPWALLLLAALSPQAAQSCSRVLSNSNGQAVVVGRTMDLRIDVQSPELTGDVSELLNRS